MGWQAWKTMMMWDVISSVAYLPHRSGDSWWLKKALLKVSSINIYVKCFPSALLWRKFPKDCQEAPRSCQGPTTREVINIPTHAPRNRKGNPERISFDKHLKVFLWGKSSFLLDLGAWSSSLLSSIEEGKMLRTWKEWVVPSSCMEDSFEEKI